MSQDQRMFGDLGVANCGRAIYRHICEMTKNLSTTTVLELWHPKVPSVQLVPECSSWWATSAVAVHCSIGFCLYTSTRDCSTQFSTHESITIPLDDPIQYRGAALVECAVLMLHPCTGRANTGFTQASHAQIPERYQACTCRRILHISVVVLVSLLGLVDCSRRRLVSSRPQTGTHGIGQLVLYPSQARYLINARVIYLLARTGDRGLDARFTPGLTLTSEGL